MQAVILAFLAAAGLLLPQPALARGGVPLTTLGATTAPRVPVFDRFHNFVGFGVPGFTNGVLYPFDASDIYAAGGGTPVVIVVGNAAPAPVCKPPEYKKPSVETTPSGVTIVRGPGTSAPAC